jgi:hypothetical protein
VHFFRPVPKEYLHSAELRDIMQFGSSNNAVFFKMRVAGVLHIFQFETKQVYFFHFVYIWLELHHIDKLVNFNSYGRLATIIFF